MMEIELTGCTPEPLACYLKALGILRLVAQQRDENVAGRWHNGVFVLRSSLDKSALIDFLVNEYHPTPILVPWSGGDFFGVDSKGNGGTFKKTPTSTAVLDAFLATTSPRLEEYRTGILCALDALVHAGIERKKDLEDKTTKAHFISTFRCIVADEILQWVDACAILSDKKAGFSAMLGSGGGSDGNAHFSDNFMQNLWEMLPDFGS